MCIAGAQVYGKWTDGRTDGRADEGLVGVAGGLSASPSDSIVRNKNKVLLKNTERKIKCIIRDSFIWNRYRAHSTCYN